MGPSMAASTNDAHRLSGIVQSESSNRSSALITIIARATSSRQYPWCQLGTTPLQCWGMPVSSSSARKWAVGILCVRAIHSGVSLAVHAKTEPAGVCTRGRQARNDGVEAACAGHHSDVTSGELRVGCSGWSYKDWRGIVYPADLPQR